MRYLCFVLDGKQSRSIFTMRSLPKYSVTAYSCLRTSRHEGGLSRRELVDQTPHRFLHRCPNTVLTAPKAIKTHRQLPSKQELESNISLQTNYHIVALSSTYVQSNGLNTDRGSVENFQNRYASDCDVPIAFELCKCRPLQRQQIFFINLDRTMCLRPCGSPSDDERRISRSGRRETI